MTPTLRSFWLLALLAAPDVQAQDPVEPPEFDLRKHLTELRSPKLTAARRDAVVAALLDTGANGAGHVFNITRIRFKKLRREFQVARTRHLRKYGAAAQRALAKQQGAQGAREVEGLREKVLSHSRGGAGLDKAVIKKVLDPAMVRLRELLEVTPEQVLVSDEDLTAQARELDEAVLELMEWHQVFDDACDILAGNDQWVRRIDDAVLPDPSGYRAELRATRALLAAQATPMSGRDAKILERNAEASGGLDLEEVRGTAELNRIRILLGVGALALDLKLSEAGRGHSADMVRLGFFAHQSPVPGKGSPSQRAALAGTSGGAENIAAGQSTGKGAIRAWWYSPGHHKNMLGSHGRVGLGRVESHWTQMFGG